MKLKTTVHKFQKTSTKSQINHNEQNSNVQNGIDENEKPIYDLEERTFLFAKEVRKFVKNLPKTISNIEDGKQLIRSSGSVGANYIEANESLSKKDFVLRIKISRKEAKESRYWLKLVEPSEDQQLERQRLSQEARELTKIFSSIVEKLTH